MATKITIEIFKKVREDIKSKKYSTSKIAYRNDVSETTVKRMKKATSFKNYKEVVTNAHNRPAKPKPGKHEKKQENQGFLSMPEPEVIDGIKFWKEGDQEAAAIEADFVNLQESIVGFGKTRKDALLDLEQKLEANQSDPDPEPSEKDQAREQAKKFGKIFAQVVIGLAAIGLFATLYIILALVVD